MMQHAQKVGSARPRAMPHMATLKATLLLLNNAPLLQLRRQNAAEGVIRS